MDFPLYHGASYQTLGADLADSNGTDVTCTTMNTKGSWVSLGTIPAGVVSFDVVIHKQDGTAYLIDIGVGAGPSVIVPNLYVRKRLYGGSCWFRIPMPLPDGQTLYARCQSASTGKIVAVSVLCKIAGQTCPAPLGVATDYGTETADTSGITIDPGGTVNTKGAWTVITASTTRNIRQILLMFGGSTEAGSTPDRSYESWLFDIGVGAAGVEKVIFPDLGVVVSSADDCPHETIYGPFDINIPAGTRITARCQSTSNDVTLGHRYLDLSILGFD